MVLTVLERWGDARRVPPLSGLRRIGVPPGGPFDLEAAALLESFADSTTEGFVEIAFGSLLVRAETGGTIATVEGGRGRRFRIESGETVRLGSARGARLLIAAAGGFELPPLGADPEDTFRLEVGARLVSADRELPPATLAKTAPERAEIVVVAGPDRELWSRADLAFRASGALDRRGVRLTGAPTHEFVIASEPCVPGAIQWTPAGELIVIGPDGPTVGGYPKPFVLLASGLSRAARVRPGDAIRLAEMERGPALEMEAAWREELGGRCARLRLAGRR